MVTHLTQSRRRFLNVPLCACGRHYIFKGADCCSFCRLEAGRYKPLPRVESVCGICGQPTEHDTCRQCAGILARNSKRSRIAERLRQKGMTLAEIGKILGGISRQRVDQLLHANQRRAREQFSRVLKTGRVQRPTACERCGTETGQLEGHHDDYNKPLDVTWLCRPCHNIVHPHHPKIRRDGGKP